MKYRKKPVVIDAVQYIGTNREEVEAFVGKKLDCELESETAYEAGQGPPIFSLIIETLEGNHKAMPNDYIIRGVKGEYYPCKPDVFDLTYEKAEDNTKQLEVEDSVQKMKEFLDSASEEELWELWIAAEEKFKNKNDYPQLVGATDTEIGKEADRIYGMNLSLSTNIQTKAFTEGARWMRDRILFLPSQDNAKVVGEFLMWMYAEGWEFEPHGQHRGMMRRGLLDDAEYRSIEDLYEAFIPHLKPE